jgi:hypothetical protein
MTVQPGITAQNPCTRYSRSGVVSSVLPKKSSASHGASRIAGGSTTTDVATLMKT